MTRKRARRERVARNAKRRRWRQRGIVMFTWNGWTRSHTIEDWRGERPMAVEIRGIVPAAIGIESIPLSLGAWR